MDNSACSKPVTVLLDGLHLVTESNSGGHWRRKSRRASTQRTLTYWRLKEVLTTPDYLPMPITITVTRIAPRQLDAADNLPSSAKHICDGIADFLFHRPGQGHRRDNDPRLTWQYAQRKGGVRQYAVEICFSASPRT